MRLRHLYASAAQLVYASAAPLVAALVLPRLGGAQAAGVTPSGEPLTAARAVALERPMAPVPSPDGRRVAFVLSRADVARNRYEEGVYVVEADGNAPIRRVGGGRLPQVVGWISNQEVVYLADTGDGRRLWRVDAAGGAARTASGHVIGAGLAAVWDPGDLRGLGQCALSVDGRYAAMLVYDTTAGVRVAAELAARPIVDTGQALADIVPSYAAVSTPVELWIHDFVTEQESRLWATPPQPISDDRVPPLFAWSPDGTHLGVVYDSGFSRAQNARFDHRPIVLLDVPSGHVIPVGQHTGVTISPQWSPDGRYLSVLSEGPVSDGDVGVIREWRYDIQTQTFAPVGAGPVPGPFAAGSRDRVSRLARRAEAERHVLLHDCATNAATRVLACIDEAATRPPQVVVQHLSPAGEPVGGVRPVTALNPELATASLGTVAAVQWPLAEGLTGRAGLVYPVGYQAGRRYPLIVMLYNQYQAGRAFLGTTFFPNFAPQVLAGRGYAVLVVDVEGRSRPAHASFDEIAWAEMGRNAASIDSGVRRVVAMGVADSTRLGVMGWSYGCMLTDYLVWKWPGRFRAAAASESGLYNPSTYWLADLGLVHGWIEPVFGGGPYDGPALAHWQAISAVYHAGEVRTPLLMEYRTTNLAGRELYRALRAHQVPAELVWYPNETHVLHQPANILASIQRHLAWFDFWLNDGGGHGTAPDSQMGRWQALREEWVASGRSRGGP